MSVQVAPGAPENCRCGTPYEDSRKRCWKCGTRPCIVCGRDTGSVFFSMCIGCGQNEKPPTQEPKPQAKTSKKGRKK